MKKIIKWPLIYLVVQLLLIFLLALAFTLTNNDINLLNDYVNKNKIFLALANIIFIPILFINYKKYNQKEEKFDYKNIILLIGIGLFLSVFYNSLMFYLNKLLNITSLYVENNNILIALISTGIIGPIIEELMFRGIIYNEAKNKYSFMKAILITNIIFALFHFSFVQMIYAFIIGFILIYIYEKYKNIKACMIVHMASNITTSLYLMFLIKDYSFNYAILIISIIMLVLLRKIYKNNEL